MLNLDTHILLHAFAGTLTPREERQLRVDSWSVSAIVLWEIAKLHERGRIEVEIDGPEFVDALRRVHVWPLTREVCWATRHLDFDSDPADELIAATSVVHHVPLMARDRVIRRSKLVPFAL